MPIVVVQGSESPGKRKKQASKSEEDEPEYLRGMDDVLHLRVYKVSQPHFFTGAVTTTLIGGDLFYKEEELEDKEHELRLIEEAKEENEVNSPKKPTLLQQIRAHKYFHRKHKKDTKEFFQMIRQDGERCKKVKAGSSFYAMITQPMNNEETLTWVIHYVVNNDFNLLENFIALDERIQRFESK
jgi:hypothetical protein